jgi:putative ABC transport system permease protein
MKMPGQLLLAMRNLLRHRARTAATLAAISIGVASLILAGGFVKDIFVQLGEATIHSQTGHIQIARQGFWAMRTRSPETHMIEKPDEIKVSLAAQPGVEQVVARINFSGMLNNGKRDLGVMGDGIEPDGEAKIGSFLRYIEGRSLTDKDIDGVVVGQGVARTLDLKIGDRVTLILNLAQGAVNTLDFQLVGVFQSFSKEFDARAVRIPLAATRELLDTEAAHLLVMSLAHTEDTDRIANAVREQVGGQGFQASTWRELSDFFEKTVQLYDAQFGVLRLIIFLMVLLSVANSINMTLFERTREFGTLLALGDNPRRVFGLIMTESALLGFFGAAFGMTLGCIAAWGISAVGIEMPPPPNSNLGYIALIRLDPMTVLTSGAVGFVAAFIASIFPAHRAANLDIVDALRHGV